VAWQTVDHMPLAAQRLFPHTDEHRRWKMQQLYEREAAPLPTAPTVLFWIPGGMQHLLHVETAIAAALQLRGYNVHAVICDAAYSACVRREVTDGIPFESWRQLCAKCIASNRAVVELMGVPYSSVGDFVSPDTRKALWVRAEQCTPDNILELSHNGVAIGHNVVSSLIRYRRGIPVEIDERVVREYAYTALISAESARIAIERFKPARVFMSHGVYVDWGPALHTSLTHLIPVTTWKSSYLAARFFFHHVTDGKLDFYQLSDRAWQERAATPLTDEEEKSLEAVLYSRYHHPVAFDMPRLHRSMGETERFRSMYRLERGRPVWGIMSHINWDSVSDYSPMAYPSFDEWIIDTIEQVSRIPEVQWLIKIHPVEAGYDGEVGVGRLIETRFPNLPSHVRLIPAAEEISPLEFFDILDGGVTVYGTSGLELAMSGKPVILAGEAHYGGRGFTEDGLDIASYRKLLARARCIGPLTAEQAALARQYAYLVFIQRQVPLPVVHDPHALWWNLQHEKREQLLPGAEPFLDFICERVIDGEDFIMGRELVELAKSDA
jgi:Capsule polysaccharide biosynthesis protein